jgi:glycosyltransferase involved in cell wall biosynthesis
MTPSPTSRDAGRIRVLLLTDEMEVGGTQRQIVHIARSLDRTRFEPTVAYFRNRSFLADELEKAGVPVVEIPKKGRLDLGFVRNLAAFLREGRFDVIHCFAFTGELWGAVARRLVASTRRPVLITSVRNKYDWYSSLQWRLKTWTAKESCRVIANSSAGGEHARIAMGLAPGSVDVVYNGVADAPEASLTPPDSRSGSMVTALFVGRLVEQKNVFVLLRAMKRLRDAGIAIRLRIAGDGPLREQCAQEIADANLVDSVEMLGQRSDTAALMASSDFVVLPSLREGLSNVILEAMIVGRPVIASAVGGSVELVQARQTGLLFPSDDDAALADAMRELIADAAMRGRLGEAGRKRAVERFTVAAMVRTMQDYYADCALRHASRRPAHQG